MSDLASGPAVTGAAAAPAGATGPDLPEASADGTTQAATVAAVRAFNRFYTNTIGLLRGKYLDTPYSLTEARILFELAQRDVSEVTGLRRAVDIDTGYLSRILARFESDGLISRQRSAADGRRQVIRLTEAGRSVVTGLDSRSAAQTRDMLAAVHAEDQRRLLEAMRLITDVLSGPAQPRGYLLRARRDRRPDQRKSLQVVRVGQRPAATGQPGLDPVDVGVRRLMVGDLGDGPADRLRRFRLALVGQFLPDGRDLVVGQLAAQEGEQRKVVHVGHALGVTRAQPVDDLAQHRGQCHVL
jgi:DNA-binding MarR family transcriptional regulator